MSCRECHHTEGQLFTPCGCIGSVHYKCLDKYRIQTGNISRCYHCHEYYNMQESGVSDTWLGILYALYLVLYYIICVAGMSLAMYMIGYIMTWAGIDGEVGIGELMSVVRQGGDFHNHGTRKLVLHAQVGLLRIAGAA